MEKRLRSAAATGTALGAWLFLREPIIAERASKAGYDYVCIDLQHGLAGFDRLPDLLQAIGTGDASPVVRVPWNEPWMIGRALDSGAIAVIIPMVNTAEEAARAVAACRYTPVGDRSFGPVGAAVRHPGYVRSADDVMCIVMVETSEAVANVDEIAAVPGVDAIYVGPADLGMTLGLPPASDHPDAVFQDALASIVDACERHGVIPAVHARSDLAQARREAGFRMVTVAFDQEPIFDALDRDLKAAQPPDL